MNRDKLYRETLKLVKETNRRLEKLEKGIDLNRGKYNPKTKRFERPDTQVIINKAGKRTRIKTSKRIKYPTGTWASKKLFDKVDNYLGQHKISISRNISTSELTVLNKALRNFLGSKTSTITGILEIEQAQKNEIRNRLEDFDTDLLDSNDIEALYSLRSDPDISYIYNFLTPSELEGIIMYSREKGYNTDRFLQEVANYINNDSPFTDLDLKEALTKVYSKFNL